MRAQQTKIESPPAPGRRSFLNLLWFGLGLAALVELGWVAWTFLRPDKKTRHQDSNDSIMIAGPVNRFVPNTVTAFPRGHFYLACLADGGLLALHRRCTHLGCTLPWDAEKRQFICPCHASVFDIQGAVVRAPAPRAMDLLPLTIENGIVQVHTAKPIRRSGFSIDQAVYPPKGTKPL